MISPFLARLRDRPILADGAMGTMLYAAGHRLDQAFEEANLTNPSLVLRIHREYLAAGAEVIESNTFGANRFRLDGRGLADQVRTINLRGVKLAREAREIAGESAFVAGAVGPIGSLFQPAGDVTLADARDAFREQIDVLVEGGADLILLETFARLDELLEAVAAARAAGDLPIVAQMTFAEGGQTLDGFAPVDVTRALAEAGADVVGVNCGVGPQSALEVVAEMATTAGRPISAMPNAGLPSRVDGRLVYVSTPEYFGEYVTRLVSAGAWLVGGCCGTTPAHIAAMRVALGTSAPVTLAEPLPNTPNIPRVEIRAPASEPGVQVSAPEAAPSHLAELFRQGKFVVSVELDPPRGIHLGKLLAGARLLREAGVDLFNVADSPMARVRMSCLASARLIQEATGLEAIIHFTTRDRNLMALQSELIGAHALGIRNVLALTGDPPRLGDYPNATGVWDVDSIGLIGILNGLNAGRDWAGTSIGRPASFFVGAAVNPTADDIEKEVARFRRKLEAGADFIMSQPLYDIETLERFLDRVGPLPVPLLLGIMPVQSFKHAEFLHNEVPGITIPTALLERMRSAGERGMAEGIAQAREFLAQARPFVSGCYLMPSFGRYEMVAEITGHLR